jgi:predicted DNA-binding transcriptional regulator YafY
MPTHAPPSVLRRLRTVERLTKHLSLVMRGKPLPTLDRLAEQHECSPRTIRRDLEAIEAAGWSVDRRRA